MTLPLWLIPALPLAGFLLNGLVALFCGWRRAAKATAEWRAAHPDDHGHDDHGHSHEDNGHGDHAGHWRPLRP